MTDRKILALLTDPWVMRRRRGKSDAVDAEAAARTALAGEDLITPKSADGPVEAMRVASGQAFRDQGPGHGDEPAPRTDRDRTH